MSLHLIASLALLSAAPAAPAAPAPAPAPAVQVDPVFLASMGKLPARYDSYTYPTSDAKVSLGRMLFYEPRLSKNQDVSCNSCHGLTTYGVDNKRVSVGHRGQTGNRNSPTVYNAGDHVAQFWDGRAGALEDQAKGPVMNPVEMAMPDEKRLVDTLASIPQYVELFKQAFPNEPQPVSLANAALAIGSFERGLITPGRFDKYLAGDQGALTGEEKAGLVKFATYGCTTCHNGAAVGGNSFQLLGQAEAYPDQKDLGRFNATRRDGDRMVFRVASLRNVEKTAPYFHNGAVPDLTTAVKQMARYQVGVNMPDEDVKQVVSFLKALTGQLPAGYIAKPALPPSTATTPKPDHT